MLLQLISCPGIREPFYDINSLTRICSNDQIYKTESHISPNLVGNSRSFSSPYFPEFGLKKTVHLFPKHYNKHCITVPRTYSTHNSKLESSHKNRSTESLSSTFENHS